MTSPLLHTTLLLVHALLTLEASADDSEHLRSSSQEELLDERALQAASFFTPAGHARYEPGASPLKISYVGSPPADMSLEEVEYAVRRALVTWSSVGCAQVTLEYAGHARTLDELDEETIPIAHVPRSQSACLQLGENTRVGAAPCIIREDRSAGVVLNLDSVRWYNLEDTVPELRRVEPQERPWVDLEATLTHEIGHILGLAHPEPLQNQRAAMLGTYRVDGSQRRLAATDRATLCALYPSQTSPLEECTSDGQCITQRRDPGATCVARGSWRVCDKEAGAAGDYCADNLLICEDFCLFTSEASVSGFCTTRCDSEEQCPEEWECRQDLTRPTSATPKLDAAQKICLPVIEASTPVGAGGCQVITRGGEREHALHEGARGWAWVILLLGGAWRWRRRRREEGARLRRS